MSTESDIQELWFEIKRSDLRGIIATTGGAQNQDRDITSQVENALSEISRLRWLIKTYGGLAYNEKEAHSRESAHAHDTMHELKEHLDRLTHAISGLQVEVVRATECLRSHAGSLTKQDLEKLGCKIMSAISEWKTKVDQTFDEIDTKLDTANTKLTGLTDDVAFLKETIDKLQTNPGPITPEDQALLDAAQARVNTLSGKAAAVSAALEALDAATERPPAPPTPV